MECLIRFPLNVVYWMVSWLEMAVSSYRTRSRFAHGTWHEELGLNNSIGSTRSEIDSLKKRKYSSSAAWLLTLVPKSGSMYLYIIYPFFRNAVLCTEKSLYLHVVRINWRKLTGSSKWSTDSLVKPWVVSNLSMLCLFSVFQLKTWQFHQRFCYFDCNSNCQIENGRLLNLTRNYDSLGVPHVAAGQSLRLVS